MKFAKNVQIKFYTSNQYFDNKALPNNYVLILMLLICLVNMLHLGASNKNPSTKTQKT